MCDAPCIFVYDCSYFTNICTIISLLYIPCLHVSTYSVIIRAFKIYQSFQNVSKIFTIYKAVKTDKHAPLNTNNAIQDNVLI